MPDHLAPHPDLAGYVLGALDPGETAAFEQHLAGCDACRAEVEQLRGLPDLLDQAAPPVEVPPGLRERTFAAVERAAAGSRRRPPLRLAAVAAAPGQSGRATAELRPAGDGVEVDMEVSGLAPNRDGGVYECWFVGPGDTLERPNRVSAGTFRVGPDGRAALRLHSGADLRRFPVMGVTLEDDGGDPRRTGDKILVSRPIG